MPRSGAKQVQVSSRERALDGNALLLHNLHVKAGIRRDKQKCGFCRNGVASISTEMAKPTSKDGVVEGDRTDKAGPTSPPRGDDGPGPEKEQLPW